MQIINPITAYPIGTLLENINDVPMRGNPEKQGVSFSRSGWLASRADPTIDADKFGAMFRRALRPLSAPTLAKARNEYDQKVAPSFPRYFIIEPTAICNRRCPFCTILVTNRKGMMSWEDFYKLMKECRDHSVYGLSLFQLGEPFLWGGRYTGNHRIDGDKIYPDRENISAMVNGAKNIGGFKAVNLSTNGDVNNLYCVLGSQLDDLIISIDGTTADVYDANRPSTKKDDAGAFDRTLQRIHTFLETKARLGEAKPFVRLQIINKENTAAQILDFIRYWIDVPGVDDVFVKNLDGMNAWLGDKIVSDEDARVKRKAIATMPCQHIYSIGSMVADGRFNACCHDAKTELTTAGANIREMKFVDWWNGEYMTTLRNEHHRGDFRSPCAECLERDPWLG